MKETKAETSRPAWPVAPLVQLMGKLEWDDRFDYKRDRSR
jgi:hypothetical protein